MTELKKRLLVVEGNDDKQIISHLCRHNSDIPLLESNIIDAEGFPNLSKRIEGEIKAEGCYAVGFVADANNSLENRWKSIKGSLEKAGIYPPGGLLDKTGCIVPGKPRVGVWLMPDNQRKGEIEDFIHTLIPDSDPIFPLAKQYIESIPTNQRLFKNKKRLRAEIHAWLAVREKPRKMGTAIRAQDLCLNDPLAVCFTDWLRELFR